MNEHLTGSDQTVILLTQQMGDMEPGLELLSTAELSELENHVKEQGHDLGYILTPAGQHAFVEMHNADQINRLLSRSFIVGMKAKQWTDNAITALCRTNQRYPQRVVELLGQNAPPVLYCIGPAHLVNNVNIAVNLPWDVGPEFYKYATQIGQGMQKLGSVIVAGGDTHHEKTLLEAAASQSSAAIGIVRTGLMKTAMEKAYRQAISRERILLVSAHDPDHEQIPEQHDHTTAKAIIHTIAGRTMLVHEGPPPGWQWTDIIPEAPPEIQINDETMTGDIPNRPR